MTNNIKQTHIKNPIIWNRKSTLLESGLTIVTLFGIVLSIDLGVEASNLMTGQIPPTLQFLLNHKQPTGNSSDIMNSSTKDNICFEKECILTAFTILRNIDENVNPCDDFYKFTCGQYIKSTMIPDDKSGTSPFHVINDELIMHIRSQIEEKIQPNEARSFVLAKNLYQACMNKDLIEEEGLEPLFTILKNFGGWPVLEGKSWDEDNFDWKKTIYEMRKNGFPFDFIIKLYVEIDAKYNTKRVIYIDQSNLGLDREYLIKGLEEKFVQAYYEYMVDIAVILGADKTIAEKELSESLEFEKELANISIPSEKRRNSTDLYNPLTLEKLQRQYPIIIWKEFINNLLPKSAQVDDEELIIVAVPIFFNKLEKLLEKSPKRTLANYLIWRVIANSVTYLNEALRDRELRFRTATSGSKEREPRWKECAELVNSRMPMSVGALYVRKHFKETAKKSALEMVDNIRESFIQILKKVDWMDEETKKNAIDKAKSMMSQIAYPDELLDDNKIDQIYEKLEMNGDNFLKNILNLTQYETDYEYEKLRKPVNKTEWSKYAYPAVVISHLQIS